MHLLRLIKTKTMSEDSREFFKHKHSESWWQPPVEQYKVC